MSKNLKPLGSKVIIERLEAESTTAGGIVLPDTAKEKPQRGVIKATGPGKLLDSGSRAEMQLKEGDQVVFTTYAGTEITVNDQELMVLDESDVLAVVV